MAVGVGFSFTVRRGEVSHFAEHVGAQFADGQYVRAFFGGSFPRAFPPTFSSREETPTDPARVAHESAPFVLIYGYPIAGRQAGLIRSWQYLTGLSAKISALSNADLWFASPKVIGKLR